MKGFDSRTSEMQIQISAGVNFYALVLKMPQYSLFLPLSLSVFFFFLFFLSFLFFFFLIAYYHFLWNKIVTGLVIYLVNFIPAMFSFSKVSQF